MYCEDGLAGTAENVAALDRVIPGYAAMDRSAQLALLDQIGRGNRPDLAQRIVAAGILSSGQIRFLRQVPGSMIGLFVHQSGASRAITSVVKAAADAARRAVGLPSSAPAVAPPTVPTLPAPPLAPPPAASLPSWVVPAAVVGAVLLLR